MVTEQKLRSPAVLFKEALIFYRRYFSVIAGLLVLPIFLNVVLKALQAEGLEASLFVITAVTVFVNILAQAALIFLVSDEGKSSAMDYLKSAWRIFWPFLWVVVLTGLASLGAALLLVVPGIIVAVFLAFSSFVMVIEDKRGIEALRASWYYVRGRWWLIFWRLLFLILILVAALIAVSLVSYILTPGNSVVARGIISAIVSGLILSPVGTVYVFLLYREIRIRNELQK
jgi:hypothetical protein